jgi:hypothetical protein
MSLQLVGYLAGGVAGQAHQNPLDPKQHLRFFIPMCLPPKSQPLSYNWLVALRKCWAHPSSIIAHSNK